MLDFIEKLLANALAILLRARSEELLQVIEGHGHVLYSVWHRLEADLCLKLAQLVQLHWLEWVATIVVHLLVEVNDLALVNAGLSEIAKSHR